MINATGNLVRYIVILLFLAVILEMILPQGTFRRYLRVLVGILLIFTILSPLQKIMHMAPLWDGDFLSPQTGINDSSLEQVLAKGERMQEENLHLALQDYRHNIFMLLEKELDDKFAKKLLQLDFVLDEESSSKNFGAVQELSLIVGDQEAATQKKREASKVQKVSIRIRPGDGEEGPPLGLPGPGDAEMQAKESIIARHLAAFLQLPLENVRVKIAP